MQEVGLTAVPLTGDRLPVVVRQLTAAGAPDRLREKFRYVNTFSLLSISLDHV